MFKQHVIWSYDQSKQDIFLLQSRKIPSTQDSCQNRMQFCGYSHLVGRCMISLGSTNSHPERWIVKQKKYAKSLWFVTKYTRCVGHLNFQFSKSERTYSTPMM